MTNEKFVAFIDILGFKEMVLENNAQSKLSNFYNTVYKLWRELGFSNDNNNEIKGLAYSDSLMIYTENDSRENLCKILKFVKKLYRKSLFNHKIMLRGGLAIGDFNYMPTIGHHTLEKSKFFGQAFIDAYKLENDSNVKGCRFVFKNDILEILKNNEINPPVIKLEGLNNEIYDYLWITKEELAENNFFDIYTFFKIAQENQWIEHYIRTLDLFCLISNVNKYDIIKQKIVENLTENM